MFEQFTYKQKFFGLIVIFVLLLLASNKRSFSVTRAMYGQLKEVEEKLKFVNDENQNVHSIVSEIAFLDNAIGKQGLAPDEVQQAIIDFSSQYKKIKVINIDETHFAESNGFDIFSNKLVLEGDFNSLSEVIYDFEKSFKQSKIISIAYERIKDYNKRKNKLQVSIIFQNYEKVNN